MKFNRRALREKTVQTLFALSIDDTQTIEHAVLSSVNVNPETDEDYSYVVEDVKSVVQSVAAINEHKLDIDARIQAQLEQWNFTRITKIDLAILRLATYEMFYVPDDSVPKKVAINEAIEIAKLYSEDKSPKFINGVLSTMLKKTEE